MYGTPIVPNASTDAARAAFYVHKRDRHKGAFDRNCDECVGLWANLLALLKGTGAAA